MTPTNPTAASASAGMQPGADRILADLLTLHPKSIELSLDRVWRLLARLGHPEQDLPPVIHVAGTNGKGSVLAMIRSGLNARGLKVHAATSPHLVRFHERIRLADRLIEEEHLVALLDECRGANAGWPITFFEITTCAALLAMAREPADFTLLETGLGGRLDATNVIAEPRMTIITQVSMDHMGFLGDRLELIAGEKAGIIKSGVPCLCAHQSPAADRVIRRKAREMAAPLSVSGVDWHVEGYQSGSLLFRDKAGTVELPRPALPGQHQIGNAGLAIAALRQLQCDQTALTAAMTDVEWPARLQRLTHGPLAAAHTPAVEIWLDGGHNPAAGEALADFLADQETGQVWLVCGMLAGKDVHGFLRPLVKHAAGLMAVSITGEAGSLAAEDMANIARAQGLAANPAASVEDALTRIAAQHVSDAPALALICGSLHLAGLVLRDNG